MFCHQCGKTVEKDAPFCKNCGIEVSLSIESDSTDHKERVVNEETDVTEEADSHQEKLHETEQKKTKVFGLKLVWIIPIFSFVLMVGVLSVYYIYETNINEEVVALQKKAEADTLDGNYREAEKTLNHALHLRPGYQVLIEDLKEVQLAKEFSKGLEETRASIKEQKYEKGEKQLLALNEKVSELTGPLLDLFQEQIEAEGSTLMVGMINEKLVDLKTVEALNDKLQVIETLSSGEGEEVKRQILTKIVKITMDEATIELNEKQFSDALITVNQGLEYKPNDEKLISLKDKINKEQKAFKQAEQQRIEQAMEAASREDLQNRTEAVEVIDLETENTLKSKKNSDAELIKELYALKERVELLERKLDNNRNTY